MSLIFLKDPCLPQGSKSRGWSSLIVEHFGSKKDKPRLIHHIHDELIYECPIDQVDAFKQMMKKSMTSCAFVNKFNVKFVVKIRDEKSWDKL